ncbi:hypothetical protein LCGC14_2638920 [marine sediment metagenome]|uniref:Uncharacterized protein n=1 Tax=marine sediment metagenome TaxID=412755 RepID=A0A0F9AKJ9_9ZZZZ
MIEYRPNLIIAEGLGELNSRWPNNMLPLYEHFARAALDIHPENLECLNDTSSINNSDLYGFCDMDDVCTTLARFLVGVMRDGNGKRRDVLFRCGIRHMHDLTKPIRLPGWDRNFQLHYDIRERKLKESWNTCHPGAVFGQTACFRFTQQCRWCFEIQYGYSHDSSSWLLALEQRYRESLHSFGCRAKKWIEELFIEESFHGGRKRIGDNRDYDAATDAVRSVFWDEHSGCNERLTELLLAIRGPGLSSSRIRLNEQRLRVIRRWMAKDRMK